MVRTRVQHMDTRPDASCHTKSGLHVRFAVRHLSARREKRESESERWSRSWYNGSLLTAEIEIQWPALAHCVQQRPELGRRWADGPGLPPAPEQHPRREPALHPPQRDRPSDPPDPRRGVCAADGSVNGTAGLYVADASLFPTSVGVNPMMTIIAFAKQVSRAVATGAADRPDRNSAGAAGAVA